MTAAVGQIRRVREIPNWLRRTTGGDILFDLVNYAFLTLVMAMVLYVLVFVVSASVSAPSAVVAGEVSLFPVDFTLSGYQKMFEHPTIMRGLLNSAWYTGVGTLVNVTLTLLAGYPLSRKDLPGRGLLIALFFFPLLFSGGMIPTFLVVRDLGLVNTRWSLILPNALSIWNLMITISFFRSSIPDELLEAAKIDGCSDFRYFTKVVLPLSRPIIAVLVLFYAVFHWNTYFDALIYLRDPDLYPLQLVMRDILILNELDVGMLSNLDSIAQQQGLKEQLKFTTIVVSALPLLIAYPFVQRHFVKGVTVGAVKG